MSQLRYLAGVSTLEFFPELCAGCRTCLDVCPHAVFESDQESAGKKVRVGDRDACMECGACRHNCPTGAITVKIGVGCAQAVFSGNAETCC